MSIRDGGPRLRVCAGGGMHSVINNVGCRGSLFMIYGSLQRYVYMTWSIAYSVCGSWYAYKTMQVAAMPHKTWQLLKVLLRLTRDLFALSPVHTSNNVEATGNIVEATFDFVKATFNFVATNGNNVERVSYNTVLWTKSNVASTLLPFLATMLPVSATMSNEISSFRLIRNKLNMLNLFQICPKTATMWKQHSTLNIQSLNL